MRILIALLGMLGVGQLQAVERIEFDVLEKSGIRRFGYPVETRLELPRPVSNKTGFRLVGPGGPIPAQFRPALDSERPGAESSQFWWLDFSISVLPFESRRLAVEFGDGIEASGDSGGLKLEALADKFQISSGNALRWQIPKNLRGLPVSLTHSNVEQLLSGAEGLFVRLADGSKVPLAELVGSRSDEGWRVDRSGSRAVALLWKGNHASTRLPDSKSTIELQFVNTKSWVRVDWRLDAPVGKCLGIGYDLRMDVGKPVAGRAKNPTLVDFGATTWVYAQLAVGEEASLMGFAKKLNPENGVQRRWELTHGAIGSAQPYVSGPDNASNQAAEGWAHIMDAQKCLALAVDQFSVASQDSIHVRGDGTVTIERRVIDTARSAQQDLRFWLHFVGNPPHVTAATSPQAMLAPLEVRLIK